MTETTDRREQAAGQPALERPLHDSVARALLGALNSLPYSGAVDWPGGFHGDPPPSAADLVASIRELGEHVRRAADEARDTALRLQHLERDVLGARRLLGIELPQRYVTSGQAAPGAWAVGEPVDPSLAGQPITVANAHRHPAVIRP